MVQEDPRIDSDILDINESDRLLMLTSAGCNVLHMLLQGPEQIVATDLNPRQNALLELKLACIRECTHAEFFAIFAHSERGVLERVYP